MRVGGIGGTPFRPFGGVRLSLGAFRQGLTALARRVPFPPNFGGVGFICRYPSPTAVQGFLKAGRKAFGDLVQKWGIRGPISQPFFPFPPTKAGARLQLPRLADVRPRLPSLPSLRPSLPKGIMDKFNNFINKFRIKPMDVGKIWKDFQAELGRHVGGTGRRPAGDVALPPSVWQDPNVVRDEQGQPVLLAATSSQPASPVSGTTKTTKTQAPSKTAQATKTQAPSKTRRPEAREKTQKNRLGKTRRIER
jgi:hypothetical protein